MVENRAGLHGKSARQPRDFDILPFAAVFSFMERGGNGGAGDKRRSIAGDRNDKMDAAIPVRPLAAEQAADCRYQRIIRIAVSVGSFTTEGRKMAMNEPWIKPA